MLQGFDLTPDHQGLVHAILTVRLDALHKTIQLSILWQAACSSYGQAGCLAAPHGQKASYAFSGPHVICRLPAMYQSVVNTKFVPQLSLPYNVQSHSQVCKFCGDLLTTSQAHIHVTVLKRPGLSIICLHMLGGVSRHTIGNVKSMLLQVDFLMSGLMVLKERIDATEALIAIDLDNRRNELVAFDLVSIMHPAPCWGVQLLQGRGPLSRW